ncbi:hypothetical protein [Hymenobacter fodinae]|uniref:Uncharacterized protein n=1 Tax=Hymenobacter fodinae TaxID=2510796 RepID=A0A4Z0PAG3_9BACT|nr:hypothetical protein [Hymenobacter fodinae]TGE08447.1 hypothetical protein EU556_12100 [Hymenobacter fodinae]
MHPLLPWLPLLFPIFFVGLFSLVSFIVSQLGWQRLARCYAAEAVPATLDRMLLAYLRIGMANYKNVVRTGVTPEGLWLTTWKIFFIGHPPLCIPWSAFGPVRTRKFLWATSYITHIDCGGSSVQFIFSSDRLREALPASIPVQE